MAGLTLDAGALIAFDRNDRRVVALLARALHHEMAIVVPAGVVGQVWRDGRRQARLARLLGSDDVEIEELDDRRAREAGQLCGVRGTADVIDASVVLTARAHRHRIATSDPDDLARLDPRAELIVVCPGGYGRRATRTLATNCGSLDSMVKPTSRNSSARSSSR